MGREGKGHSHPGACANAVVVGPGRGEAAEKGELKKWRDTNVGPECENACDSPLSSW